MPDHHHEAEAMPIQRHHGKRNARRHFSPQDRIRICRAIHRQIMLEYWQTGTDRRNVLARMAIGLPPIPRSIYWERLR
jgi:hypothetical protein